ncbi:VOC family protein [Tolypothrix campylonemoides VB511288]|nr:VOC family protein [Tolypothrix campylonemoides VB511288]
MTLYMVELTVADMARSVGWYRDVLGWSITRQDERNGFTLLSGKAASGFADTRLALKRGTPPDDSGFRLHFLVPDLSAELARLVALGIHPESPVKTSDEGYRRAAFRDPDGHAVTLFEWVAGE